MGCTQGWMGRVVKWLLCEKRQRKNAFVKYSFCLLANLVKNGVLKKMPVTEHIVKITRGNGVSAVRDTKEDVRTVVYTSHEPVSWWQDPSIMIMIAFSRKQHLV